jgi:hypothetical protein
MTEERMQCWFVAIEKQIKRSDLHEIISGFAENRFETQLTGLVSVSNSLIGVGEHLIVFTSHSDAAKACVIIEGAVPKGMKMWPFGRFS